MSVLPACTSIQHTYAGTKGGMKRVLHPLQLDCELLCGTRSQAQVLGKSSQYFKPLSNLSSPRFLINKAETKLKPIKQNDYEEGNAYKTQT